MTEGVSGLVVADKPAGLTSHDVVAVVRRALGGARVGHAGTLDPLATGVLPLVIGSATRLLRFLPGDPKVYRARARLGFETTTGDVDGQPLGPLAPVLATADEIARAVRSLLGPQLQTPPMYSARKVAGQRLYRAARAGREVHRAPTPIVIHAVEPLAAAEGELAFEVSCSPGTYVRALVSDLGRRLGCGACLIALRRIRSGVFDLSRAVAPEQLADRTELLRCLLPLDELPLQLEPVELPASSVLAFRNGKAVALEPETAAGTVQVRGPGNALIGVGELAVGPGERLLLPRVVVAQPS